MTRVLLQFENEDARDDIVMTMHERRNWFHRRFWRKDVAELGWCVGCSADLSRIERAVEWIQFQEQLQQERQTVNKENDG